MSATLVRWSASLGFQLLSSLARLLGTRVASALFVSATGSVFFHSLTLPAPVSCFPFSIATNSFFVQGRVLLRVLVHTIGGPFALIPQSILASALNSVVPSPVVLLRGVRAGVRVVYLLLETPLAQGARRMLVHLTNASFTAPLPEQRAQWLAVHSAPIDEYEPRARLLHVPSVSASSPLPSDSVCQAEDGVTGSVPSEHLQTSGLVAHTAPIVLELTEKELNQVEAHFDGERAHLDASALQDFLKFAPISVSHSCDSCINFLFREHGRDDEAALTASRIVTGGTLDDSWCPAELLLRSRHSALGGGEVSATLGLAVGGSSSSSEDAEEGWVALGDLCEASSQKAGLQS